MVLKLIYINSIFIGEYIKFKFNNLINKYLKNIPCIERIELLKKITEKLEKINIVYIKLFQSLCINEKILYNNEKDYLLKYTDNVPFDADDIDYKLLDRLERCYNIRLDDEPLNSGIVSVAFKGIYNNDNNKVVIKILKKNIHNKLIEVFDELYTGARLLNYIPYIKSLNIQKILDDNKELILKQTNFEREVENLIIFKEKNKNINEFKIPLVYEGITDVFENIIIMENIKGLTYKDIENYDAYTKNEFGKLILKFGFISILYNNAIHCDLHPGNIFFYINDTTTNTNANAKLPKYQIGIIDFGIVSLPTKIKQNIYYEIFNEILIKKSLEVAYDIILYNLLEPKEYINALPSDIKLNIKESLNNILRQNLTNNNNNNVSISFIFDLVNFFKKYKLTFNKEFNQLLLSFQMSISLATNLCTNILEEQNNVFNELNHVNKLLEFN
jgi:predicted unusual protein kinase regulating ubiquinone biosynthesis (AarF/ABC1/UbiB family)